MQNYYGNSWQNDVASSGTGQKSISQVSSNAFMQRVFGIMSIGLVITGLTAFGVSMNVELMQMIFGSPLRWVVMLAPFAFILIFSFGINRLSYLTANLLFGLFALTMGISLSSIFVVYTSASIASTFFITAGMFGAMAFIGATTKRDLTKMGSILMMVLVGVIIASLVNIFLKSSAMNWIISFVSVFVFAGFTAYDMQKLVDMSQAEDGSEWAKKSSVLGALTLYLDFINLFLSLLRILGNRD